MFLLLIMALHQRGGTGCLEEVARTALAFYVQFLPMSAAILATPGRREGISSRNAGPQRAKEGVAAHLRREQELGRIDSNAEPEAAAALLLSAYQQRAVLALFHGEELLVDRKPSARDLVQTLMRGLLPQKALGNGKTQQHVSGEK